MNTFLRVSLIICSYCCCCCCVSSLADSMTQHATDVFANDSPNSGTIDLHTENAIHSPFHVNATTTPPADNCIGINGEGEEYWEFSCLYPELGAYYYSWEKFYDPTPGLHWMEANPSFPIVAIVVYAIAIVAGKAYFANRDRWNWHYTLAAWNLGLSMFSWMGMFRTLPHLLYILETKSLKETMCCDPMVTYGSGSTGLWMQLFVASKFPELLDTFFILIHKKKLIFLHWYHHITVLLYCWYSYVMKAPQSIFFVVMNYSVHATMYGYYCLMTLNMRPKWFNPMVVTGMQISQMVLGVAITLMGFYYSKTYPDCSIQTENNMAAFVMYGSYLFLFLEFFVGRYLRTATRPKKKKSA